MTVAEAAKFLGVEYDYVRRLLKVGKLKGRKAANGMWVVDEESVRSRSVGLRGASTPEDEVRTVIK